MTTPIKNMLVGVLILGAISLLVVVILFLKPSVGDGKQTLYVRFSSINGLSVGTRVLFAGKPVGEVVSLEEIHDARHQPTDELGRVYFYQLTLHVDSSVNVYNTDEISIQSSGLLGERSISITPKAPPKGVAPRLITSQPIYADSIDPFQNAILDFSDLAVQMEETFKQAGDWIKHHGEEVAGTIKAADTTLTQFHTAMRELEAKQAFQNIGDVINNVKSASHSFETVAADMAQGKGTLGKLVVDNDLYLQANAVMTKANNLMNDLNHYGLLFHLNKQWQRTRLQKINELNALQSPQAFRTYFQTEVDDINASMSRLSMLIDRAENSAQKKAIFQSAHFKQDFADLLRRVDELSDNLRLYNQQLMQAEGN